MISTSSQMVDHAIAYARRGWLPFPIHSPTRRGCSCGHRDCGSPGKHPRTSNGLMAATTDLETIEAWWWRWPTAGIAVVVPAGHLVVDVDPRHGGAETLAELDLPPTLTVITGGGGEHRYYVHPGGDLRQGANVLGPGVDTRMPVRGYVLVPPSKHASGRRYRWLDPGAPVVSLPERVLQLLRPRPALAVHKSACERQQPRKGRGAWAAAALSMEATAVRMAPQGTRNHTLNSSAFSLGQIVAGGLLDLHETAGVLLDAAIASGLGEVEAQRTITSGLRAGQQQPRRTA